MGDAGEDTSSSEDRFAREDARSYSGWSSAVVIVGTIIVVILVAVAYLYNEGDTSRLARHHTNRAFAALKIPHY